VSTRSFLNRILIVGVPRSGTTWTLWVLGTARHTAIVSEPDNAARSARADAVRVQRGAFAALTSEERADDYARIFDLAFAADWPSFKWLDRAHRRLGWPPRLGLEAVARVASIARGERNVVVKSVYAVATAEWLATRYAPRVVVVDRNPLNIVSSWLDVGIPPDEVELSPWVRPFADALGLPPPRTDAPLLDRIAWAVGILRTRQMLMVRANPAWLVVTHEELCVSAHLRFRRLFDDLALDWSAATDRFLKSSDRPGSGYTTNRLRRDLSRAWATRMSQPSAERVADILRAFPLGLDPLGRAP
jgi:hypothetical protein